MRLVQMKNKTKELDKSGAYALKNTCVRSQVKKITPFTSS